MEQRRILYEETGGVGGLLRPGRRGGTPPRRPRPQLTGPRCVLTVVAMVLPARALPAERGRAGDSPSATELRRQKLSPGGHRRHGQLTADPALQRRTHTHARTYARTFPAGACALDLHSPPREEGRASAVCARAELHRPGPHPSP